MSAFEIHNRTNELKKLKLNIEAAAEELSKIKNMVTEGGTNKLETQAKPGFKSQVATEIQTEAHNRLKHLNDILDQTLNTFNSLKKQNYGRDVHVNFHGQIGKLKGDIHIVESAITNLKEKLVAIEKKLVEIASLSEPQTMSSKTNELASQFNDYKVKLESVKGSEGPLIDIKKNDFDFEGFSIGLAMATALIHDWIKNKKSDS